MEKERFLYEAQKNILGAEKELTLVLNTTIDNITDIDTTLE